MKIVCQCDKSTASYGTTKKIVRKQWHKVTEKENREVKRIAHKKRNIRNKNDWKRRITHENYQVWQCEKGTIWIQNENHCVWICFMHKKSNLSACCRLLERGFLYLTVFHKSSFNSFYTDFFLLLPYYHHIFFPWILTAVGLIRDSMFISYRIFESNTFACNIHATLRLQLYVFAWLVCRTMGNT